MDDDPCTLGGKRASDLAADSARGAGDEHDAVG
jgi:hypothetical protein